MDYVFFLVCLVVMFITFKKSPVCSQKPKKGYKQVMDPETKEIFWKK